MGSDVLRLLRAAGHQDGHYAEDSEPAEDLHEPLDRHRAGLAEVQDKYVFSRKPTPALLAEDNWHPERVRKDLVDCLERTGSCHVEVILKDISTVRYKPQRLWEWEKIAMEVVQQYAK